MSASSLPATPTGRMETPLDDQGPTLGTQAPPLPPLPEAALHPFPQTECAETVRVSAVAGPLRHSGLSSKEASGGGGSPCGRGRFIAGEDGCSARCRRSCSPNSAVAVPGSDGEMLGLYRCLAGGCRDAAPMHAPASLRSRPRRAF